MCFTTLSHEFTSENSSLIISVLDLLRNCANRLPPKNEEQAGNFKEGFDLGDLPNTNQINDLMTDYYLLISCINTFKGYVFRRMMDWIKVMPDLELAAQITSALSRSFNISVLNTPH